MTARLGKLSRPTLGTNPLILHIPCSLSNNKPGTSVLTKNTSAEVEITLRGIQVAGSTVSTRGIAIERFAINKDMGRILIRRGGETIAAGMRVPSLNLPYVR